MARTKITSKVLALSAAQTNINNDGSFTLSVPTQINNTLTTNSSVSVGGNLIVDTNTLFVDSVNNRVGIGTTTPDNPLTVQFNSNSSALAGVKLLNSNGSGKAVFTAINNAGVAVSVGVFGNSFGSGLANTATIASSTGVVIMSNGEVGSGGTDPISFRTGGYSVGAERMRIDSSGNVGIGTTSPSTPLHTYTAGNNSLTIEAGTGDSQVMLKSGGSLKFLFGYEDSDDGFRIYNYGTSATALFVKSTTGNVGIGTTSPSAKLHAIATTEQLRVGYDASNYLSTTVDSTGVTTLSAVGSGAKFAFSNNVEVTAAGGVAGSTIKIGGSGMALGFAAGGSSFSGVWCNNATPDFSNYTFLGDGNDSLFNAKATGKNYFRTGNITRMMVDQNGVFIPGVAPNANPTTQQLTVIPSAASKIGAVIKGFTSQTANLIEWQDSAGVVLASVTASGNISTTGHFSAATKSFKIPHQSKGGHLQYGVVESDCHSVLVRGKISSDTITLPEHWSWLVDADSVTVQLTPVGCYQQLYVISSDNQTVKVGGVTGEYCYVVYGTRKDVAPLEVEIE